MEKILNLQRILQTVSLLSTIEKLKLIQTLTTQIESEIESDLKVTQPTPRQLLRGLWRGLDISEAEITEARKEMWAHFSNK